MLPGEQLGIAVLTNGAPVGLADSVALDFFDIAQQGEPTTDWLSLVDKVYQQQLDADRSPTDYSKPPGNAAAARSDDTYTGTYENDYYGPLTVTASDGELTMSLGPRPTTFRLTHFDGDTFSFRTAGENASGLSGVTFDVGSGSENAGGSKASKVTVEAFDENGLGTFTRP